MASNDPENLPAPSKDRVNSGRRVQRREFLQGATLGVGALVAGRGALLTPTRATANTADQSATVSHPVEHDFMRWPRMFTTDGHEFDTEAAPVDIRGVCRTIAEASGKIYRLTAHTFMGYVYYDSKYPPKAPGLGSQDWFAEAREETRKSGVKLVGYFNFNGYRTDNPCYGKYDVRKENGDPMVWYQICHAACLSWPGWHDRMLAIIDEAVRKYDLDGVYTDWMGWLTCYCEQCQKLFHDAYGIPIPDGRSLARYGVGLDYPGFIEGEDFITDEAVKHYAEWKRKVTEDMINAIRDTARRAKPGALTMHHMHPDSATMAGYGGTLVEGGELNRPDWLWRSGSFANAANVYPLPVFANLYGNNGVSREEYKLRAAQVFANGCYPNIISVPLPDTRQLGGAAEIFHLVDQNQEYFDFNRTERVKFVALPRSPLNSNVIGDSLVEHTHPLGIDGRLGKPVTVDGKTELIGLDGKPLETYPAIRKSPAIYVTRFVSPRAGTYGALTLSGIPVSSVARQYFLDQFKDYPVLCLANAAYMRDSEVDRVREFVSNGGGLIATHETSLYDEHGAKRPDFALADVFGLHYAATDRYWGALGDYQLHFKITASHPVNKGFPLNIRIRNCELVVPVNLNGATSLVAVVNPAENNYIDTGNGHIGSLRDSLRVGKELGPAVTVNEFGKGRVVYFAGRPGSMFLHWAIPEMRAWLENAVEWVSRGQTPVRIKAQAPVSAGLFRQPNRHVLHLVNLSVATTPVDRMPDLTDVEVQVRIPPGVKLRRVWGLVAKKDLTYAPAATGVRIHLPRLAEYEVIALEHA